MARLAVDDAQVPEVVCLGHSMSLNEESYDRKIVHLGPTSITYFLSTGSCPAGLWAISMVAPMGIFKIVHISTDVDVAT